MKRWMNVNHGQKSREQKDKALDKQQINQEWKEIGVDNLEQDRKNEKLNSLKQFEPNDPRESNKYSDMDRNDNYRRSEQYSRFSKPNNRGRNQQQQRSQSDRQRPIQEGRRIPEGAYVSKDDRLNEINAEIIQCQLTGDTKKETDLIEELQNLLQDQGTKRKRDLNPSEPSDTNQNTKRIKSSNSSGINSSGQHTNLDNTNKTNDCKYCYLNRKYPKNLIIALGNQSFLAIPENGGILDNHCLIIPMAHEACSTMCDDSIYEEISLFKESLSKMYQDKQFIFLETSTTLSKKKFHFFIECIPLKRKDFEAAPGYFKKALLEAGSEWANNKKLIEVGSSISNKSNSGIRREIPSGFPYFYVDFGGRNGYAHVIESKITWHFGRDIIGGMMGLTTFDLNKKLLLNEDEQRKRVTKFLEKYSAVDWTKQLDS